MMNLLIEISAGELLDKLTILDIKSERIVDPETLPAVAEQARRLKAINERLWDIENAIRAKEAASAFDDVFIQLARAVYITNDERATVKKAVKRSRIPKSSRAHATYG